MSSSRVKVVTSKVVGCVKETLYQDIKSGRTWSVYESIPAKVIELNKILEAMDNEDKYRQVYSMDDIPF